MQELPTFDTDVYTYIEKNFPEKKQQDSLLGIYAIYRENMCVIDAFVQLMFDIITMLNAVIKIASKKKDEYEQDALH